MDTNQIPDVGQFIDDLGGTANVARDCEITDSAVSQWREKNKIPKPWLKYFHAKYPEKFMPNRRKHGHRQSPDRRVDGK